MLTRISVALGAGFLGALVNVLALLLIRFLQDGMFHFDQGFLYKQVFWGAAWALLYCSPLLKSQYILRAFLVGTLASFFTFFVFQTIPLNPANILRAFLVNVVAWGLVSSYIYYRCTALIGK